MAEDHHRVHRANFALNILNRVYPDKQPITVRSAEIRTGAYIGAGAAITQTRNFFFEMLARFGQRLVRPLKSDDGISIKGKNAAGTACLALPHAGK